MPAALLLLALSTVSPLTGQSRVAELNEAGWKALASRNADLGARLFAEALILQPNDAVLMFGAGAAAHLQGRRDEALWRLRRAVELNPRLTEASRLLGAIAYEGGDVNLAIATYEQALKHAPADEQLVEALALWRKDADTHGSFTERRDHRFTVLYEGPRQEATATQAVALLNAAFTKISAKLGTYPSSAIFVVLYTDQQFRDITRSPSWASGLYDGRIRVPAAGASENPALFDRVLTHELTHAVIAGLAPRRVPAWLHEGMAQYFEGIDVARARARLKASPGPLALKDLENGFAAKSADEARMAYDVSLAAVSLIFERAGFGWGTFFSDLAEGTPCEDALIRRFGYSYGDLEAALKR